MSDNPQDLELNLRKPRSTASDSSLRKARAEEQPEHLSPEALRSKARQISREFDTEFLAKLPEIPGYHCVWASTVARNTGNPRWYERKGYVPVHKSDAPNFQENSDSVTANKYADFITCNELLAMKVPEEMYQEYMLIDHHERPRGRESGYVDSVRNLQDQVAASNSGSKLIAEGDIGEPRKVSRTPTFT